MPVDRNPGPRRPRLPMVPAAVTADQASGQSSAGAAITAVLAVVAGFASMLFLATIVSEAWRLASGGPAPGWALTAASAAGFAAGAAAVAGPGAVRAFARRRRAAIPDDKPEPQSAPTGR